MVQIIQERPSFKQQLLGGLAQAIPAGLEGYNQFRERSLQQQEQQLRRQNLRSFAEELGLPSGFEYLEPSVQSSALSHHYKNQTKSYQPLKVKDLSSFLQGIGYDRDMLAEIDPEDYERMLTRVNDLAPHLGEEAALFQVLRELKNQEGEFPTVYESESPRSFAQKFSEQLSPFKKGLRSSASGRLAALAEGISPEDYERQIALNEPGFTERLMHAAGKITGDLPYIGAGGTLGAQAGGALGSVLGPFGAGAGALLGGGAGAMAFPAMLDTALEEFHRYQNSGYEGSFEDFVNSVGKTIQSGLNPAVEGAIFGTLSKALPVLKGNPKLKSAIEKTGVPESVISGAIEASGLLGAKGIARGEIPSEDEIVDTFAQVIGINLATRLPKSISKIQDTLLPPREIADAVALEIEATGTDPRNVKEVSRIINDITESYSGAERTAAKDVLETLRGIESPEPRKVAEALAERPIESTLEAERKSTERKARPLTEKEQTKRQRAREGAGLIQEKIDRAVADIDSARAALESPRNKDRELYRSVIRSKEAEIADLTKKHKSLMSVAEKGVEPFSREALEEPIQKHMKELREAAREPMGETAKDWERMFARDQKYIDEFTNILKMNELPPAPYRDRYIKTLDAYQDAYRNFLSETEKLYNEKQEAFKGLDKRTKAAKRAREELGYYKNMLDLTRKNQQINDAKVGKQLDKISQLYQLKKPGSALTKQILKDLRKDIPELQKEFVQQQKKLEALDKKSEKLFDNQVKTLDKLIQDYRKNPSELLVKRIADESGIDIGEAKQARSEGKKIAQKLMKEASQEVPVDSAIEKAIGMFRKYYPENPIARAVLWAIIGTEVQDRIQKLTGMKVPVSTLTMTIRAAMPKNLIEGGIAGFYTYGLSSVYKQLKDTYSEWSKRSEYRNLKTSHQRAQFVKQLKKEGYSSRDIKSIVGI